MVLTLPRRCAIAAAFLLLGQESTLVAAGKTKRKLEFLRAMKEDGSLDLAKFESALEGSSKASSKLRKTVISKAKLSSSAGRTLKSQKSAEARSLGADDFYSYDDKVQDGTDDYFTGNNAANNEFGFDASQYSLKYQRCAEVKSFDDEAAAQEDSEGVFSTKHFVVFRFCPAMSCGEDGGCDSNYGEYMLELTDYLGVMQEYHEEHFQNYCAYCDACMYSEYKAWLKSQNGGDDDGGGNRDLQSSYFDDNFEHSCTEYESCKQYQDVCEEYQDDDANEYQNYYNNGDNDADEEAFDVEEYFECTAYERNNGKVAYIGPHCKSDGMTISLGIYSDEMCNNYIGKSVSIEAFINQEIDEEVFRQYYDPEDQPCIPCRAGDTLYENVDGDDDDGNADDEINDLCAGLYESSARCDKQFRSYNERYSNADQMDLNCDFIASVVEGSYDEYGFIKLRRGNATIANNFLQNNEIYQEYVQYVQEVSPGQIFGICFSIAACLILTAWSCTLNRSLSKKAPWRPRRGLGQPASPGASSQVTRQNSGIVMGRSRSGGSYYMT